MPADTARIDELDQSILTLCTRINAATYELLVMIREFDERCGWLQWGLDNCAEWLAWRCDLSMTTAREKVRVAHALKQLPLIARSFSSGELSYAKVRAMTRVATRDNEADLLGFALRHTAVTSVYRATRDLFLAQRFARHASPLTTVIYTHPSDDEMRRQVSDLDC